MRESGLNARLRLRNFGLVFLNGGLVRRDEILLLFFLLVSRYNIRKINSSSTCILLIFFVEQRFIHTCFLTMKTAKLVEFPEGASIQDE